MMGGQKLSHKFVGGLNRPVMSPVRLTSIFTTIPPKMESIRPTTHAGDIVPPGVFTEQPGAPSFPPPTCSPASGDPVTLLCGRLRLRGDEVPSETNLFLLHSCASTAAKSKTVTRSGYYYDRLVSVHRGFEPAGRSLRKILRVVVGKTYSRVIGRLYGLTEITMVCTDMDYTVLSLMRPTRAGASIAGERWSSASGQPQKMARNTHYT